MIRKLTTIFLIVATLATLLRFTFPYVWYYSNYDYIVSELCENRHDPDAECDGFCVLKKKIKTDHNHQNQEQNEDAPQRINHSLKVNLFFSHGHYFSLKPHLHHTSSFWLNNAAVFSLWDGEIITPPPQLV